MSDCVILLFHWEMMCWNRHPAALCVLLHSLIHLYGFISPCWRRYVTRAEELLGSPVRSVCHVLSRKRFVSAGGGSQQDFTQRLPPGGEAASWLLAKDTASTDLITTCAFSALQPWGTGVNAAPTLTYSQKPALLLFIYSSSPPSLFCLLHLLPLVSRRLQDWLHYPCLFFSHPSHSLRDVNKSDSRDRWNDRISLSAGSLATFPSSLFDSHLLSSVWLRLQQHILLDLVSTF